MRFSWFDRLIFRLTHRRWNRLISRVLSEHYGLRKGSARLDSHQLHVLAAEFDPTQGAQPWERTRVAKANTYSDSSGNRRYDVEAIRTT